MPRTPKLVLMNVVSTLTEELGFADREIDETTSFAELGADGYDVIDLCENFGITLSLEEAEAFKTVGELVQHIVADAA